MELNTMSVHALSERVAELEQQLAAAEAIIEGERDRAKEREIEYHEQRRMREDAEAELERVQNRVVEIGIAAEALADAETDYRHAHDFKGDGSIEAGRAWDNMHRKSKALRDALASPAAEPQRSNTVEAVQEALQKAWDDYCADAHEFPDCFEIIRGRRLGMMADFSAGNFARMVAAELNNAAQPAPATERASKTGAWSPVTAPGQIGVGSWLCFTVAGRFFCTQAKDVLHPGTDREEVIYNRKMNHYFITSMAVDGSSSHKNVMVARLDNQTAPATEPTQCPHCVEKDAQIARDEEHHQAAMTMSEKHRKNWVEVSQKLAAIKDELDDAREELSISESQRVRDFELANEWKAANSHLIRVLSKARALPDAWRARADKVPYLDDVVEAHQKCAEELERALTPPAAEPVNRRDNLSNDEAETLLTVLDFLCSTHDQPTYAQELVNMFAPDFDWLRKRIAEENMGDWLDQLKPAARAAI